MSRAHISYHAAPPSESDEVGTERTTDQEAFADTDAEQLANLGYKQQLYRSLSAIGAAAFAYTVLLTIHAFK